MNQYGDQMVPRMHAQFLFLTPSFLATGQTVEIIVKIRQLLEK